MSNSRPLDLAMLRAYGEARCLDYGGDPQDVSALRGRVEKGERWAEVALRLATLHASEARLLQDRPTHEAAVLLRAVACMRLAQAAMEEEPARRVATYERLCGLFELAMKCSPVDCERIAPRAGKVAHTGWLFPCGQRERWALVWGGADGWCEAYHRSVPAYHAEGISVCLLELPGQGLVRLRDRSYLSAGISSFVSSVIDMIMARHPQAAEGHFALVGHSLGGSLALRAAADDGRVAACVTNGGSVTPERGFQAYPRVMRRFARMLGPEADEQQALAFLGDLDLASAATGMRASLLCLHGARDELVGHEELRALAALKPDMDCRTWDDGTHCIYNHADERNRVLAQWLSARLAS